MLKHCMRFVSWQLLNDHPLVDFVAFMRMYSQIAYPLFIWSV